MHARQMCVAVLQCLRCDSVSVVLPVVCADWIIKFGFVIYFFKSKTTLVLFAACTLYFHHLYYYMNALTHSLAPTSQAIAESGEFFAPKIFA